MAEVLFGVETLTDSEAAEQDSRCVVRLRRAWWNDRHGLHQHVDLTFLKRECRNYNILEEDATSIGADEVAAHIDNLDECRDGIYEVTTCNEKRDWESGCIEEYDYHLIPYSKERKSG